MKKLRHWQNKKDYLYWTVVYHNEVSPSDFKKRKINHHSRILKFSYEPTSILNLRTAKVTATVGIYSPLESVSPETFPKEH